MTAEQDDVALAAAEDAAFASGFSDKPVDKPKPEATLEDKPAKVEATEPVAQPIEKPDYVRVTKKEWEEVRAAATRTASYDQQFSKLFGTLGNMQKTVSGLQSQTPSGKKVTIPADAFAAMERDFPELAQQTRGALEAALAGVTGTGPTADIDASKIEGMLTTYAVKRETEALEDEYPDWREKVGAVDVKSGQKPDPNHPFRTWLATKDESYQKRLNETESAAVISRAIRLFEKETGGTANETPPNPRDTARAERIRGAITPKGDRAGVAAGPSDDDEFMAGFNSR